MGADLPGNEMAEAAILPGGRVDLPDGCEIVLSTQVLEHVLDPRVYLAGSLRLLRPGGRVIVSTHGYWWYHPDPTDFWRRTGEGLRCQVEEAGFRVLKLEGGGRPGRARLAACSRTPSTCASGRPHELRSPWSCNR
jgi:SAM-dependent methyltransferase